MPASIPPAQPQLRNRCRARATPSPASLSSGQHQLRRRGRFPTTPTSRSLPHGVPEGRHFFAMVSAMPPVPRRRHSAAATLLPPPRCRDHAPGNSTRCRCSGERYPLPVPRPCEGCATGNGYPIWPQRHRQRMRAWVLPACGHGTSSQAGDSCRTGRGVPVRRFLAVGGVLRPSGRGVLPVLLAAVGTQVEDVIGEQQPVRRCSRRRTTSRAMNGQAISPHDTGTAAEKGE